MPTLCCTCMLSCFRGVLCYLFAHCVIASSALLCIRMIQNNVFGVSNSLCYTHYASWYDWRMSNIIWRAIHFRNYNFPLFVLRALSRSIWNISILYFFYIDTWIWLFQRCGFPVKNDELQNQVNNNLNLFYDDDQSTRKYLKLGGCALLYI